MNGKRNTARGTEMKKKEFERITKANSEHEYWYNNITKKDICTKCKSEKLTKPTLTEWLETKIINLELQRPRLMSYSLISNRACVNRLREIKNKIKSGEFSGL
jgi:hypothetical protein